MATLTEGLAQDELLRSRLTRAEVLRQLKVLADSVAQVDATARAEMPELDCSGCEALVPATLLWLGVYPQNQPELFRIGA